MFYREQALIDRVRGGDRQAFDQLVHPYRQRLLGLCCEMLEDGDDAQDAVQQALTRAYQSIESFRGDAEFFTWLWSITRNVCNNMLRARRAALRQNTISLDTTENPQLANQPASDPPVAEQVLGPLQPLWDAVMDRAEGKWKKQDYDLFMLLYGEGKTYKEIAAIWHISEGALRSRKHERIQPVLDAVRRDLGK